MKDTIEIGDKVRITWAAPESSIEGTVLYTPQDTGNSWRIRSLDGALCYVQLFELM